MKKWICSFLIAAIVQQAHCQVLADPAIAQLDITTPTNIPENVNALALNKAVVLKVPIYNFSQSDALPAGSCKLRVRLGSNLLLNPTFDLSTAPLNNYFSWSSATVSGQIEITGDLIAPLPEDFIGSAEFAVLCNPIGTSNIVADFLVTNHNTATILDDEDPANNTASLQYTVTTPLPVNFLSVNLRRLGCDIGVRFSVAEETNLSYYAIETSEDGTHFTKIGQLTALGQSQYEHIIKPPANLSARHTVYVRIQSFDKDNTTHYSDVKSVALPCLAAAQALQVFPNPLPHGQSTMYIKTKPGIFKGALSISLMDYSGKYLLSRKVIAAPGAAGFIIGTGGLAAGQYFLTIQDSTKSAPLVLPFQQW